MNAKCNNFINKYKKHSPTIPKSSESFKWKDVNWKKIELRLNILQNKIYAARKNLNIWQVRKLQRLILNSYDFKKLAVRKVTQLNRGKKTAGVDDIKNLNEKQKVWLVDNLRITNNV